MTGQFNLVKITSNDIKALVSLSKETFYDSFSWANTAENMKSYMEESLSEESLLAELSLPASSFYFALADGKRVGYIKLNFGNAQKEALGSDAVELERIYVVKESQGMGIGQRLLDSVIEIARQHSCKKLWLGVWERNDGAIRFYERNGFEKFGTHPFMLGSDKQTDILMMRALA